MRFIPISLLLLSCVTISAQKKSEIAGKIKSVVVNETRYEKGFETEKFKESEIKYDINGNTLEEIEYKKGKVDKHLSYQYDSQNNKIKEIEYNAAGKVIKTTEYKYTGNLKTERTVYDENGKKKSVRKYQYEKF